MNPCFTLIAKALLLLLLGCSILFTTPAAAEGQLARDQDKRAVGELTAEVCVAEVCAYDERCCEAEWNEHCAVLALTLCDLIDTGPSELAIDDTDGELAGLIPCGGQNQPCCVTIFPPSCTCNSGFTNIAGICVAVSPCVSNPCGPTCDPECNPFCGSVFDPCLCAGGSCGCPTSGSCCSANNNPGCIDPTCCVPICASDPFCCNTEWDSICASAANESCALCNPCISNPCGSGCGAACNPLCPQFNACACEPGPCNPACPEFNECVCSGIICGCPTAGSCCESNGSPGCVDPFCCEQICSSDPFCCNTAWDSLCAAAAQDSCALCDACLANPCGPTCSPECNPICSQFDACACSPGPCNPACPQFDECECLGFSCGCPTSGSCCSANGSPSCLDPVCCEAVCLLDSSCCSNEWDETCAQLASNFCPPCNPCLLNPCASSCEPECNPNCSAYDPCACGTQVCGCDDAGSCCDAQANGSPGCSDAACCAAVCTADSFCCEVEWDSLCVQSANQQCQSCVPPLVAGDLNGDGLVDVFDLLILLDAWGPCPEQGSCPADLNYDGVVNVFDLLIVLENWG